ncbi:MAG: hypothetical protein HKL81_07135 [Acidimicrobiaceae bacterium]|nr:hypothetical protein [Acidimicrobiaceae bacterium]
MTEVTSKRFDKVEEGMPEEKGPSVKDFKIVPMKGLPFVAIMIIGLIVSIAGNWQWALDFYHVVGGGLWTAFDLFLGFVLGPIMGKMSIPSRMEFTSKLMPKMLLIMPTVVTMTLGSGFQLARKLNNLNPGAAAHGWLVASFIVVGVMTVIALGILEPANLAVLFEMKKENPNGAVIGRLMKRFIYTAGITGAMQIGTLIIMTRVATL